MRATDAPCSAQLNNQRYTIQHLMEVIMSTQLDPLVSEFKTQEQADSYDRWFRQRIERSLADPRPAVPHDEAMARVKAVIEAKRRRAG
ncbi:hypothetical protein D3C76_518920 [compost metagenome]